MIGLSISYTYLIGFRTKIYIINKKEVIIIFNKFSTILDYFFHLYITCQYPALYYQIIRYPS